MTASIDRRRALQLIASLGAILATAAISEAAVCPAWLMANRTELDGLRELGREYIGRHPQDSAIGGVWSLISSERPQSETLHDLEQRIRGDYEAGDIVRLSGWYVSVTEARTFAALSTHC
jgi:hypothetical protein